MQFVRRGIYAVVMLAGYFGIWQMPSPDEDILKSMRFLSPVFQQPGKAVCQLLTLRQKVAVVEFHPIHVAVIDLLTQYRAHAVEHLILLLLRHEPVVCLF